MTHVESLHQLLKSGSAITVTGEGNAYTVAVDGVSGHGETFAEAFNDATATEALRAA